MEIAWNAFMVDQTRLTQTTQTRLTQTQSCLISFLKYFSMNFATGTLVLAPFVHKSPTCFREIVSMVANSCLSLVATVMPTLEPLLCITSIIVASVSIPPACLDSGIIGTLVAFEVLAAWGVVVGAHSFGNG